MSNINYNALATDWIDAWNKRDIDRIMNHYANDVEFHSPTVNKRWNITEGKLIGKEKLKQHFLKGFEEMPNLHFEFINVVEGKNSVTINYKRENGQLVSDYVEFDENGKGKLVKAYYHPK
ncbi:MAG TPA: nuclear transport factor 2 family protein [Ferruginibacter sp.]|jgi:ketosteroid isomerase-like protein|nr:nuclear transport factor 2 family protein [Ferruginibacter sp.]